MSVTDLLDLSSVSLPSTGSSPPLLVPCGLASPPSYASLGGSSPPPPSASSQPVEVSSSSSGHRLGSEPPEPSPPSSTLSSLPSTTPTSASASAPPSATASFVSESCLRRLSSAPVTSTFVQGLGFSLSSYTANANIRYASLLK